jgi:hypothetical protein
MSYEQFYRFKAYLDLAREPMAAKVPRFLDIEGLGLGDLF